MRVTYIMKNLECYICFNDLRLIDFVSTSCNHYFCTKCCSKIVTQNDSLCPMCRRKFDFILNQNLYYQHVKTFR